MSANEITIIVGAREAPSAATALTSVDQRLRKVAQSAAGGPGSAAESLERVDKRAAGLGGTLRRVGEVAAGVLLADAAQRMAARARALIQSTVAAASNLGESVNAVGKVFGSSTKEVLAWGQANANAVGLSQRAFNQAATPLGSMLKNQGLQMDQVTQHTIRLTERAADMASVFNTDVSDALMAIQAGLRGEIDPLERYGVSLSAVAVEARALADTGKTAAKELTAQEKALARLSILYEQTADTAGDFRDTSDGLANSQRIAAAATEDAKAKLGTAFLPVMAKAAQVSALFATAVAGLPQPLVLLTAVVGGLAAAMVLLAPRVVATKTALDTMAASDSRLQRGMSRTAVVVGKAGAALAALAVAGQLVGNVLGKDLNPRLDALEKGLDRFAKGNMASGETARVFGEDVEELDRALSAAVATGFSKYSDAVSETILGMLGADRVFVDARARVEAFDASLASMVQNGNADVAALLVEMMAAKAEVSAERLKSVLPAYSAALETGTKATTALGKAAEETARGIDELDKETSEYIDKAFGLEEAEDAVAEAVARLREQIAKQREEHDKGAGSLTGNTRAARDNRELVRELTEKYQKLMVEYGKVGRSTEDLTEDFAATLRSMGFSRAEAERYIKILADLKAGLDEIESKSVTVKVNIQENIRGTYGRGNLEFAHGGIVGAASGGPRGSWTMVGERGRELVKLPWGSQVIPNGTTEAMLAGGGGGVARIEVGGRPSGPLESLFLQWLLDALARTVSGMGGRPDILGLRLP